MYPNLQREKGRETKNDFPKRKANCKKVSSTGEKKKKSLLVYFETAKTLTLK